MKRSRRRVLRRVGLIEEAHRNHRVEAPMPHAEPYIVIGVDQHASHQQAQGAPAEERHG